MMRARLAVGLPALVAFAAAALAAVATACGGYDQNALTEVVGPDYGQFKGVLPDGGQSTGVSQMLEKRCGTLDCHGQVGRPLRIYGQTGLRFKDDAGNVPGGAATTETEHEADYQSVIGLQPELMTEVVQLNAPPEALLLMRKPLQLERHKGGQVLQTDDDGYNCITSWLMGQIDYTSCSDASM
jgi:hypothetical protein